MSAGTAGSVNVETKGFVVWGCGVDQGARFLEKGTGQLVWSEDDAPTVFPSLELAVGAVLQAGTRYPSGLGRITIKRVLATTVTETKIEYKPLDD